MTAVFRFLAVGIAGLCAGPATASPASAIPWLTEGLKNASPVVAPMEAASDIREGPVGRPVRDGAGVLTAQMSGLPRDLWRGMTVADARAAIEAVQVPDLAALQSLFVRLLLAETDPPAGASDGSLFLIARIDQLLRMGALSQAEALIEAGQPDTAELFRRWFDVEILTGHAERACEALRASPMLAPSTQIRIYCLARMGDWDAAGIALQAAERIGDLEPDDADLLALFVDPALMEGMDAPPASEPIKALEFVIREAAGLPVSRSDLPLAFHQMDLRRHVPIRFRIEAAERLVLAGAVEPQVLFTLYRAEVPAASGGVWDRAAAVQALDAARGDVSALGAMDKVMSPIGLRTAAAIAMARDLAGLDPAQLGEADRHLALNYLLLGGMTPGEGWVRADDPAPLRAAAALRGVKVPSPRAEDPPFAMLAAFEAGNLLDLLPPGARVLAQNNETGAAILQALSLLAPDEAGDAGDVTAALALLRLAGQDAAARAAAIEMLLATLPLSGQ